MLEFTNTNIRTWAHLGSCGAFGLAAVELGEEYDDLAIFTADLRFYSGLDRFASQYPGKLYNIGIAEQNMIGVAAGMANEGFNVFATTYGTFASTRCCDQVRVNMGYMKIPVKLVGLTSGLSVGILGATHMSFEDIAIMRSIPNITILSPADCTETVKATLAAAKLDGPVYLRLTGIMGNPIVYKKDYDFQIGKAIKLMDGTDIAIIATGTMVASSLKAAKELTEDGISCSVIDMHTIKPIDRDMIISCIDKKLLVTVEEHNIIGGLGSAVAEVLSNINQKPRQLIIGINDEFKHAADYKYLIEEYGITPMQIAKKVKDEYFKGER
jgi:Transketolase, C-terminal subunit